MIIRDNFNGLCIYYTILDAILEYTLHYKKIDYKTMHCVTLAADYN